MTAPRRRARSRPAVIRAAVYGWLEEIKFRTGMIALAALAGVLGGAIAAGALLAQGGAQASAGPRPPEQRAAVATPVTTATPAASPLRRSPKPQHASRHTAHPADATGTAAGQDATQPVAPAPPPAGHHSGGGRGGHPGRPHPHGGPHPHGWPAPHGWPDPHGWSHGHGGPHPHGWPGREHGHGDPPGQGD